MSSVWSCACVLPVQRNGSPAVLGTYSSAAAAPHCTEASSAPPAPPPSSEHAPSAAASAPPPVRLHQPCAEPAAPYPRGPEAEEKVRTNFGALWLREGVCVSMVVTHTHTHT